MATPNTTTITVTYKRSSTSPELWVPYVLIGTTCVVFLAVHFWCYHKRNRIRYLRKREEWRVKSGLLERRRITTLMVARYQSELGITPSTSSGNGTSCRPWAFDSCGNGSSSPVYNEALVPDNDMVQVVVESQSPSSVSNPNQTKTPSTHSLAIATTKASAAPVAGHALGQLVANYGGQTNPCVDQNQSHSHLREPEDTLIQPSAFSKGDSKALTPKREVEGIFNTDQFTGRGEETSQITANTAFCNDELNSKDQRDNKDRQGEALKNAGLNTDILISCDEQTKPGGASESLANTQDTVRHPVQLVQPLREESVSDEEAFGNNAFNYTKRKDRSQRDSESLPWRPLLSKCRQDSTLSEGGSPVSTHIYSNTEDNDEHNNLSKLFKEFSECTGHSITPEHGSLEKSNLKHKEQYEKNASSENCSQSVPSNQVELSNEQACNQKTSTYKPSIFTSDTQKASTLSSPDISSRDRHTSSPHAAGRAHSQRSTTLPVLSQMAETSFSHLKSPKTAVAWGSQDSAEPLPPTPAMRPKTAPSHTSKESKQYGESPKNSSVTTNDSRSTGHTSGGANPKMIFQCKRSKENISDSTDL